MGFFPTSAGYRPNDPMLQGIISGLANKDGSLIADSLLTPIFNGSASKPGKENFSTGTIQRFATDAFFGDPTNAGPIAPGQDFPESRGVGLDPMTYVVSKYGRQGKIAREIIQDAQMGGMAAQNHIYALLMARPVVDTQIEKERRFASLFQTSANWTTNTATIVAGSGWNLTGSDPVGDINNMVHKVGAYGCMPTDFIVPRQCVIDLQTNSQMNEYRSTTSDRTMLSVPQLVDMLKALFGFKRVHLAMGRYNSSAVAGTLTGSDIWTDNPWMGCLDSGGTSIGSGNVTVSQTAVAAIASEGWSQSQEEKMSNQTHYGYVWYRQWEGIIQEQLGGIIINANNTAP